MRTDGDESLAQVLGGRRAALDSGLPVAGFTLGWLAGSPALWHRLGFTDPPGFLRFFAFVGHGMPDDAAGGALGAGGSLAAAAAVGIGAAAAMLVAAGVAAWRLRQGRTVAATVVSLLVVCLGAIVALHTGRAEDFFLVRLLSNAASALAWAASVLVRWPLLGVIAGTALGQRTRWRRDPALLRAYRRASWVWVIQYLVRLAVMVPLWWAGHVVWLATAQVALTWPLVAACLAVSWWVLRRSLPPGHPGLRHPQPASPRHGQAVPEHPGGEPGTDAPTTDPAHTNGTTAQVGAAQVGAASGSEVERGDAEGVGGERAAERGREVRSP